MMKCHPQGSIDEALAEEHICRVLITCKKPTEGGFMEVELRYEGDPVLATYLVHSACDFLDGEELVEGLQGAL